MLPRKARIKIIFDKDDEGQLEKLVTPRDHAGRGGAFTWVFQNDYGKPLWVDLRKFSPAGFLGNFDDHPVQVIKKARFSADVIDALPNQQQQIVTYEVWADDGSGWVKLDPDLEIDGDKGGFPKGGKKKGGKKR